MTNKVVS